MATRGECRSHYSHSLGASVDRNVDSGELLGRTSNTEREHRTSNAAADLIPATCDFDAVRPSRIQNLVDLAAIRLDPELLVSRNRGA